MDKMLKHLHILKDVGSRLRDLSQGRAVPPNLVPNLFEQSDSIKWAYDELMKIYFSNVLLVIGHPDIVLSLGGVDPNDVFLLGDNVASVVLIMPDKLVRDKVMERFSCGQEGNKLSKDKSPEWLVCDKYFCACQKDQRVAIFDCVLSRNWINEVGYATAKRVISTWLHRIFNAMKWDEATKTGGDGDGEAL